MNFLPLVLGFLLLKNFNLFGTKDNKNNGENDSTTQQNTGGFELDGLLDRVEDAQNTLNLVSTFNKMRKNEMNMTELLGEIMNNPVALNFVSKLGFGANASQNNTQDSDFDRDFADLTKKAQAKDSDKTPPQNPTIDPQNQSEDTPPINPINANNTQGKDFATQSSVTETLFKPVEKIAGVEVVDQLKKYYENWYVK